MKKNDPLEEEIARLRRQLDEAAEEIVIPEVLPKAPWKGEDFETSLNKVRFEEWVEGVHAMLKQVVEQLDELRDTVISLEMRVADLETWRRMP